MEKLLVSLSLLFTMLVPCKSEEKILYFQDIVVDLSKEIQGARDNTLQIQDQNSILVSSKDAELASLFNLKFSNHTTTSAGNGPSVLGYNLDDAGCIDFHVLGRLKVVSMTHYQISELLEECLMKENLVWEPVVTVGFMNFYFPVLREVDASGKYSFSKDQVLLLKALVGADYFSITGKHNAIFVIPEEEGHCFTHRVDLCSKDVFRSPSFIITLFNPIGGKLSLIVNMTLGFASKGKKVPLVDGDMYHSSLRQGLDNYFSGNAVTCQKMTVNHSELKLISVGAVIQNFTELFENSCPQCLSEVLRSEFDYIFLDCLPVDFIADTQFISQMDDCPSPLVVRAGLLARTMQSVQSMCDEKCFKGRAMILNGIESNCSRYRYFCGHGDYYIHK